ncbi:hypothetical protein EQ500_06810 [Lactobacillus sp. XV13L]|nr:hypothetical protein [Lactobacillus sp. XV13L]
MRLTDLLQLTNDLSGQTALYAAMNNHLQPLAKLKISSSSCLLYPGKEPLTKAKIFRMVQNLHGRSIPLYVKSKTKKIPLYGIQIHPELNAIILM